MDTTIHQKSLTSIDISRASSGNIVLIQESINEDSSSVIVEPESLPYLIRALNYYLKTEG